jgi:hypothetical protein
MVCNSLRDEGFRMKPSVGTFRHFDESRNLVALIFGLCLFVVGRFRATGELLSFA